tara:strand:+ start:1100 stop:1765 length:666 start_codon:yes stop_codon:yes gene_type:complete
MINRNAAILFDMDGVTIDTEPLYTRAEIRLFKEYGVIIPKKDYSLFRGCSEKTFFDLSMKRYGIVENKEIFISKGRKYVLEEFSKGVPFVPGFKRLHCWVSKNYYTGLVTASPKSSLNFICKKINLQNYFLHMLSGEETNKNKPHPDPYVKMMSKLGVHPQNTIIIEDSISGIRSGLSAKAHVIAKSGSVAKEYLNNAHRIINDYKEITPTFLEELLQEDI